MVMASARGGALGMGGAARVRGLFDRREEAVRDADIFCNFIV